MLETYPSGISLELTSLGLSWAAAATAVRMPLALKGRRLLPAGAETRVQHYTGSMMA